MAESSISIKSTPSDVEETELRSEDLEKYEGKEGVGFFDDISEIEEFADKIVVKISSITGLPVLFTAADISITVRFQNKVLATSDVTPLTDQESMPVDFSFEIPVDGASPNCLDTLASCPLHFTVTETAGTYDLELYPPRGKQDASNELDTIQSTECEEVLGILPEQPEDKQRRRSSEDKKNKKGKLDKQSNKSSKDSSKKSLTERKDSKLSSSKTGSKGNSKSAETLNTAIKVVGIGSMSLMPFLEGETKLETELVLQQATIVDDERLVTYMDLPRMNVSAELNGKKLLPEGLPPNIMSFTIESIYNPPPTFNENLKYVAGTYLPINAIPGSGDDRKVKTILPQTQTVDLTAIKFDQGNYTTATSSSNVFKKWHNLLGQEDNTSIYTEERISSATKGVRNNVPDLNIQDTIDADRPRVIWNVMRQCSLKPIELENVVKYHMIRHRCWPLEFFVASSPSSPAGKSRQSNRKESSRGSNVSRKGKKGLISSEPLHLMAFVDITRLLCPGETKTRVACEVRTFQFDELKEETGWEDSLFMPKPKPPTPQSEKASVLEKTESQGKQSKEKVKGKDAKGSTTDKINQLKKKSANLKAEEEQEPSVALLDEEGNPTFVIVEISFKRPIYPQRTLEDLSADIYKMLPKREEMSPFVVNKTLARRKMEECFKTIISKLYSEYKKYLQHLEGPYPTSIHYQGGHLHNFVEFIQQSGVYQVCLMTLIKDALLYVQQHFNIENIVEKDGQETSDYEVLMSNVYVHLVRLLNRILNGPLTCGLDAKKFDPPDYTLSDCWRRVCEADELGAKTLALRYVDEIVASQPREPDAWLLRAVYHLGHGDCDRANECIKECLALKIDHEFGLLLYAIQFYERDDLRSSETTFLSLIAYYPSSLVGWVCLLAFYAAQTGDRIARAACELCSDRILLLSPAGSVEEENDTPWPYGGRDDLAWAVGNVRPAGDKFLAVAATLLRLRALKYAEMVMGLMPGVASVDIAASQGERRYYTAVSHYLRRDYEGALTLLRDAVRKKGHDHNIGALEGHCLFQMGQPERAIELYECALRLFAQPKCAHLVHLRLALAYDRMGKPVEDVKKCLLYVCSRLPTPYDWLLLGACYYKESSWTIAEDCLSEANLLDRGIPDTWAYLTLINIRIGRPWIASQCYQQMLKHDLQTEWLLKLVQNEISKLEAWNE